MMWVANCGAAATASLGFVGLLFPAVLGRLLGIRPDWPLSVSEFRMTYAWFCLVQGLGCLLTQRVVVFTLVGFLWCASAALHAAMLVRDRRHSWLDISAVSFEVILGLAMLTARL